MALIWTLATSMRFWLGMVIVSLTLFGTVQTLRLNEALDDLNKIRTLTDIARNQSDATLEHLQQAVPRMVEQVEKNTWRIAKSRFGTCPVAVSPIPDSLLPAIGGGEDATLGGSEQDRERVGIPRPVLEALARDVGRLKLCLQACEGNPLICEFK